MRAGLVHAVTSALMSHPREREEIRELLRTGRSRDAGRRRYIRRVAKDDDGETGRAPERRAPERRAPERAAPARALSVRAARRASRRRRALVVAVAIAAAFGALARAAWLDGRYVHAALFAAYALAAAAVARTDLVRKTTRLLRAALAGRRSGSRRATFFLGWGAWRAGVLRSTALGVTALAALAALALAGLRAPALPLGLGLVFALLGLRDAAWATVGPRGIGFRRILARSRFVPYRAIERVDVRGKDVRVVLRDGSRLVVHDALHLHLTPRAGARSSERRGALGGSADPKTFARAVARRLTPPDGE
jgi:hypothetical protein